MNSNQKTLSISSVANLHLLEPATLQFDHVDGRLNLTVKGSDMVPQVTVKRAFPLSDADHFLSVRDQDDKEIGIITDIHDLNPQSRSIVEQELNRRYVTPIIQKVVSVKEQFGNSEWEVQTNRGPRKFTTRRLRENVLRPEPNKYLIQDMENNRYQIDDITQLDTKSQSILLQRL